MIEGPPIPNASSSMGWTNTHHVETNVQLAKIILPTTSLGEQLLSFFFFSFLFFFSPL